MNNYGIQGGDKIENVWGGTGGITLYGQGCGGFEEALVANHAKDFNSDCVISIFDVWAWSKVPQELQNNMMPFCPYTPVDMDELNDLFIQNLQTAFRIIPMSQHSEDCIKKHFPNKTYPHIPPGIDLDIYKPLWNTVEEKNKLKTKFGFSEDTFVVVMAGDIKGGRKKWAENLEGVKIFREKNPHIKLGVYIHTNLRMISQFDFNIDKLVGKFGLTNITRAVDPYHYLKGVSDEEMALMYNMADVFLQASQSEGFGMQFCEAAAVGTPSIGTNWTSVKQSINDGRTGYLVRSIFNQFDQAICRRAIPDIEDIAHKLELIHHKGSTTFREDCLRHAQQFDWKTKIIPRWLETLEQLKKDIDNEGFKIPEPSEELKNRSKQIFEVGNGN